MERHILINLTTYEVMPEFQSCRVETPVLKKGYPASC